MLTYINGHKHSSHSFHFHKLQTKFLLKKKNIYVYKKKEATLMLASSSESNPSFQTFHWKIISLQFNAISVLYVPLFLFEEQ